MTRRTLLRVGAAIASVAAAVLFAGNSSTGVYAASAPSPSPSPFTFVLRGGDSTHPDGTPYTVRQPAVVNAVTFSATVRGTAATACQAIKITEFPGNSAITIDVNGDRTKLPLPLTLPLNARLRSVHCNDGSATIAADVLIHGQKVSKSEAVVLLVLKPGEQARPAMPHDDVAISALATASTAPGSCAALTIHPANITLTIGEGWAVPFVASAGANGPLFYIPRGSTVSMAACPDRAPVPDALLISGTVVHLATKMLQ